MFGRSGQDIMEAPLYRDRAHAGVDLGVRLEEQMDRLDRLVILALPRGGVPVAYEIARKLQAPLDVFLVRKLGVPGHEEFAFGAIATGGVEVLNEGTIKQLQLREETVGRVVAEQRTELERRESLYRRDRAPAEVKGRTAVLVDDGLATGASMRAAVQAVRQHGPESVVVAVPVGAPDTCDSLRKEVDAVVCGYEPASFQAVGMWYADFAQTTDEEVIEKLDEAATWKQALWEDR